MNVVAVQGSPRKNGNTALLLKEFLRGISENSNAEISQIFLQENNIKGCMSCNVCKTTGECVIKDDMHKFYKVFKEADVVIYATPIYWWNMSSQLKTFIDRLYALKHNDYKGKKVYLLMTYGGALPNSGPELVEKIFREICNCVDVELIKVYGVCTDAYMPVKDNKQALQEVYNLGKQI